jgi:hypothetical protein
MKLQKLYTILLFAFAALQFSCGSDKPSGLSEYGPVFESVMRTDSGAFRGFELGTPMDTVMAREPAQPAEVDDLYLYYEYSLPDGAGSYDLSYDFDENGLIEINSDIFLRDPAMTEAALAGFKKYFDKIYGASENHGGFNVWTVRSESFGKVRINLSDSSAELSADGSPGKLSLWIYLEKE